MTEGALRGIVGMWLCTCSHNDMRRPLYTGRAKSAPGMLLLLMPLLIYGPRRPVMYILCILWT